MTSITEDGVAPQRPKRVTTGVQLLFASLALGTIAAVTRVVMQTSGVTLIAALMFALVFFTIGFLLVWRIAAGSNLARIIWLVLVLVGTPFALRTYLATLRVHMLSGSLSIFISVLQLIGTYLLITGSSHSWFRKQR